MRKDIYDLDLSPPHPGEVLKLDVLSHVDISMAALARHLGLSARVLREVLAERRPVTLDIARRLGAAFGQGTRYWLGLQIQFDIFHASQDAAPIVAPLPVRPKVRSASGRIMQGVPAAGTNRYAARAI